MNLIEAVATGKPFRHIGDDYWIVRDPYANPSSDKPVFYYLVKENEELELYYLSEEDVLANDYEVLE